MYIAHEKLWLVFWGPPPIFRYHRFNSFLYLYPQGKLIFLGFFTFFWGKNKFGRKRFFFWKNQGFLEFFWEKTFFLSFWGKIQVQKKRFLGGGNHQTLKKTLVTTRPFLFWGKFWVSGVTFPENSGVTYPRISRAEKFWGKF